MASSALDPTTIALQLEAVTAQIRALSSLPEVQREEATQQAVNDVKMEVDEMKNTEQRLQSEVQSLRDTIEDRMKAVDAQVHNNKIWMLNGFCPNIASRILPLRNVKTNEKISGFPTTAEGVTMLDHDSANSICNELGFTVPIPGWTLKYGRMLLLKLIGYQGPIPNDV